MRLLLIALVILIPLSVPMSINGQDWPALRGSSGYGVTETVSGVLRSTSEVSFETRWKRKLGSGYSSVVVSGNNVVTMYTDGTDDWVVCLNASDGSTIWQTKTNPMFKGLNGSFDGPLSTPLIFDQHVYALSAVGKFYCFDLNNGKEVWSRDLVKEDQAKQPLYGFVSSPIEVNGTIVLQTGVAEKSVFGFDPKTGNVRWTAGNDVINSQSPTNVVFQGQPVVLASGGKKLLGIDPDTGNVRFDIEHAGGNGSAVMPVPIGDNRVLLTLDDQYSKAFQLRPGNENAIAVSEDWQQPSIRNTYNMPVLSGDGVFAFSTRILTCVDPASGRALWKSRKPGDGFLIVVDGHLIMNTKKGALHLAKASVEGYREIAKLDLFNDLVWSVPAYQDNAVFTRSLGEIARVDIVRKQGEKVAAKTAMTVSENFESFLGTVAQAATPNLKAELVDQWLKSQASFPVVDKGIAHFVYRGEHADVALAGDFFGARQEQPMVRVKGTDLFYYGLKLPADQRVNYCFLIDYQPVVDPRNDQVVTSSIYAGEMEFAMRLEGKPMLKMSWFGMPEWKRPSYLDARNKKLAGKLVDLMIELDSPEPQTEKAGESTSDEPSPISEVTKIKFQVYLPPGYETSKSRYPVAYVFGADDAKKYGDLVTFVDRVFAAKKLPADQAILVLVNGIGPQFAQQVVDEVVPFVDKNYSTKPERESRMLFGCGFFGGAALITALRNEKVFGKVASQSLLAFAAEEKMIRDSIAAAKLPMKVHLQWGRFDMFNPHENWDIRAISKKIFELLSKGEKYKVVGGQVNDSADWSSWRNRYEEIFQFLNRG